MLGTEGIPSNLGFTRFQRKEALCNSYQGDFGFLRTEEMHPYTSPWATQHTPVCGSHAADSHDIQLSGATSQVVIEVYTSETIVSHLAHISSCETNSQISP